MASRDILALGASAGGVEALRCLASGFPRDLPASVLVTMHLSSEFRSNLDTILSRSGPLEASFAADGEALQQRHIYIAPREHHLIVDGDRLALGAGPRENHARPAIDPMLRSTAACCGSRAIGVVVTGTLGDGASGLWALKEYGGLTVVQDPDDAAFPEMPVTALSRTKPDHVVTLAEMPALLERLVSEPAGTPIPASDQIKYEIEVARGGRASMDDMDRIGRRSVVTCPDCGGVMWQIDEGALLRYRCHLGHAYTAELTSLALDDNLRRALSSAQRALEERIAVTQKLHEEAQASGRNRFADTWARKTREFEQEAAVLREATQRLIEITTGGTNEQATQE